MVDYTTTNKGANWTGSVYVFVSRIPYIVNDLFIFMGLE